MLIPFVRIVIMCWPLIGYSSVFTAASSLEKNETKQFTFDGNTIYNHSFQTFNGESLDTVAKSPMVTSSFGQTGHSRARPDGNFTRSSVLNFNNLTLNSLAPVAYSENNRLNLQFFKALFRDTGHVLSSPIRWNKGEWLTFAAVSGIAGGLYFIDSELRDWSQKNQSDTGKLFADIGTYFGSGTNVIVMFSGFYLYGELFDGRKARRTALLGFESALITSLLTQSMKFMFHRHRPHTQDPPDTFDGPSFKPQNLSFPSGHSTAAFSIATVIASEYKHIAVVPPTVYGLAILAAFSRIHKNVHWGTDVFTGFAIGFFTSKTVLKLHSNAHNVLMLPSVSKNSLGFSVSSLF